MVNKVIPVYKKGNFELMDNDNAFMQTANDGVDSGRSLEGIFCDLRKAFDCVSYDILFFGLYVG